MTSPELLDPTVAELGSRLRAAMAASGLPEMDPGFERPKQAEHGDWASTVALRLAREAGWPPREIAETLAQMIVLPDLVDAVEVAGPGFLNFRFAHAWFEGLVRTVLEKGASYGHLEVVQPKTVNVEFVSANPTGPLHVGHGRWAATGDSIAALIEAAGDHIVREYYVNDAGEQIRVFGESVVLSHRQAPLGEGHYQGAYIGELAVELADARGSDVFERENIGELAVAAMRRHIERTLQRMSVTYDVWFSEESLHVSGAIEQTIEDLVAADHTYVKDGAVFLRTEARGDDKDRVLVRSDGRPTYFAADCAYLREKWSRADHLFYLLGADHHGYVARLRAAAGCLGIPEDRLEVRIGQLVNLLRAGEPVRMSKRAGELITLDEVLDDVGVDVARYHFLRQGLDSQIDFDLAVVAQESMENPVYYVQYAHARIASLVRTADDRDFDAGAVDDADLSVLTHDAELALLASMARLPQTVAEAAELRATQRLAHYAEDLAGTFHRFYTECRVLVEDEQLARARYWLARGAMQVLANTLALLRVSAPEQM